MGLTFAKKGAAAAPNTAASSASKAADETKASTETKSAAKAETTSSTVPNFMKKGAAAKAAIEREDAKAEAAKAEAGRMKRFWMKEDEERDITFLDGKLDDEGMLDVPMFYEHHMVVGGEHMNFVCTADTDQENPCPGCSDGDKPTLVGALTIINHTPYTIKKGQNAGKVLKDQRVLYVATRKTLKMLTKHAVKRGGSLAGCRFEASRTGDKEPRVGNQYEFVQKFDTRSEIAAQFNLKEEDVQPANYSEEIIYRTVDELIALGIGKGMKKGIGYEKGMAGVKDLL